MRFMPAETTMGTQTVGCWEVVSLFEGTDGVPYARLANASDASRAAPATSSRTRSSIEGSAEARASVHKA